MKTKYFSLLLLIPLLYSCFIKLPDEELTMTRTPYNGKEIRLDGCYFEKEPGYEKYGNYLFFYSNGLMLYIGDTININTISQFSGGIKNMTNYKQQWHIFQIENKTINIQGWTEVVGTFSGYLAVHNEIYTILNDTTVSTEDSRIYYFKKFSPKPDSTNVFIK